MSHNRARARAARAARAAATQSTAVVPVDPTAELPVFGGLLLEERLPDEATWDVPDFAPWDDLIPRPVVGTATAEHLVVRPVEDTAYTVQDAAALLDLLAGDTRQVPVLAGRRGLLGLTAEPVPQDGRWFR